MKLFKSLLIAPAAFGLMAPIAVNADTAFSPTSKLGSSVNFTIGSNTDSADGDELHSTYEMKFKSTTSFTVKTNLLESLKLVMVKHWVVESILKVVRAAVQHQHLLIFIINSHYLMA